MHKTTQACSRNQFLAACGSTLINVFFSILNLSLEAFSKETMRLRSKTNMLASNYFIAIKCDFQPSVCLYLMQDEHGPIAINRVLQVAGNQDTLKQVSTNVMIDKLSKFSLRLASSFR